MNIKKNYYYPKLKRSFSTFDMTSFMKMSTVNYYARSSKGIPAGRSKAHPSVSTFALMKRKEPGS
ncbi:hypothetical protein KEH51_07525 [[Brevibacterium] frigoritolerans]|uniref:Uncharacterized protein n=1 Tax=Peribacillus frigoritolerans TaxID=450367 RepID=A0A941FPW8_9BACI|nr:hypothetical protein [Peribacillus frigoritolerans]